MIRLYAVVDGLGGESVPSGAGVALETREIEGLHVVLSTDPPAAEPSDEALLRHALVVEDLMASSAAVLPARFGDDFPDEESLVRAIRDRSAALREALRRVHGCVEIGLRVLGPDRAQASMPVESGSAYMERRLAEVSASERLVRDLHGPLAELARESVVQRSASPVLLLAAYLLPPDLVTAFQDQLRRLEASHPELDFVCTGPWAPYSFASLPPEESD